MELSENNLKTLEKNKRLSQQARRSASNEAGLILTAFGALLWIALIAFDRVSMVSLNLSLPQLGVIAFLISALLSTVWYLFARKIIKHAEFEYNEVMKAKKAEMREKHLNTLRQRK